MRGSVTYAGQRRCATLAALTAFGGGCGRIGFDGPGAPDAHVCTAPVRAIPAPPEGPWSAPALVVELSSPDFEDDPTLTDELLEIYFQSNRGGTARLWRSTRADAAAPWPAPSPVSELDAYSPNTPKISRDGLRLSFSATDPPTGTAALYVVTRPDRQSPWGTPTRLDELFSATGDTGGAQFLDGFGLVFYSNRPGGPGGGDLWETFLDGAGCATYAPPRPIAGDVNSANSEANAWMRDDGLALAFQTGRAGGSGNGDIYVATRASIDEPFGRAVEQIALDSGAVDDDPWMNDAMTTVYFMSTRTGNGELYVATR